MLKSRDLQPTHLLSGHQHLVKYQHTGDNGIIRKLSGNCRVRNRYANIEFKPIHCPSVLIAMKHKCDPKPLLTAFQCLFFQDCER